MGELRTWKMVPTAVVYAGSKPATAVAYGPRYERTLTVVAVDDLLAMLDELAQPHDGEDPGIVFDAGYAAALTDIHERITGGDDA